MVCSDPVLYRGKKLITPKLRAPFICDTCRADKKKLKAAREEQWKFIGKPEPTTGWEG